MPDYTILIVDYDPRSLEAARAPLAAAGYKVVTASDGLAGLEAFSRNKPDLVLIEAMLPKKHGFEVCQVIKNSPEGRGTPILITTAVYKGRKYRTQALHIYGCDEYVEKPIAPEALIELCGRFLKVGSGVPDASKRAAAPAPTMAAPAPASSAAMSAVAFSATPAPVAAKSPLISPTRPQGARASGSPSSSTAGAIVADLTEDEIMARLDMILPDDGMKVPCWTDSSAVPELEPASTSAVPRHEEIPHQTVASAPAREETVPEVLASLSDALSAAPAGAPENAEAEEDQQVVQFDAARARKRRQTRAAVPPSGGVTDPTVATQAIPAPDLRLGTPARKETPRPAVASPAHVHERPVPRVARAAVEAEPFAVGMPRKTGIPWWAWVAVTGAVATGALYLALGTSGRGKIPTPAETRQAPAVTEPSLPQRDDGPVASPTRTPTPASAQKPLVESRRREPVTRPVAQPPAPAKATATQAPRSAALTSAPSTPAPAPVRQVAPPTVARQVPSPATTPPGPATAVVQRPAPPAAAEHAQPATVAPPSAAEVNPAPTTRAASQAAAEPPPVTAPSTAEAPPLAAPQNAVARGALLGLDEVDVKPRPINRPPPAYTARARSLGQQGSVFLNLLINETGRVTDVQIIQGILDSDLNDAAAKAARGWTYEPATKGGVPVKVWLFEKLRFEP